MTIKCEWCGTQYPKGHYDYYEVKVFAEHHIICKDCYNHLNPVEEE